MKIIQIILTVMLLSVGQIFFKMAADRIGQNPTLLGTVTNPVLIAALGIYALATVLWVLALRGTPLSFAYPFAALAFLFVPIMTHFTLGEPLRMNHFYGFVLILSGVWISVRE